MYCIEYVYGKIIFKMNIVLYLYNMVNIYNYILEDFVKKEDLRVGFICDLIFYNIWFFW